jgi:hypothetical protein
MMNKGTHKGGYSLLRARLRPSARLGSSQIESAVRHPHATGHRRSTDSVGLRGRRELFVPQTHTRIHARSRAPHLHFRCIHLAHICAGTGLAPATSAPGLTGLNPCHICAGTGLTPATSAPGLTGLRCCHGLQARRTHTAVRHARVRRHDHQRATHSARLHRQGPPPLRPPFPAPPFRHVHRRSRDYHPDATWAHTRTHLHTRTHTRTHTRARAHTHTFLL